MPSISALHVGLRSGFGADRVGLRGRTAPAPAPALPLDALSAAAAYSTRRLRTAYTGPALRVRRSSDNAEQDIGFGADGWLDQDALLNHCATPRRPLDAIVGAAAAYGLHQLRTAYTGPAIRVRRSSDNAEADIGFTVAGDLDTAALQTFVGVGSGFVTTWYDQSGNGRNAVQTTADNQPRIVNAGVIETAGGKPTIVFDGVNDGLVTSSWGAFAQPFTRSMVIRTPATIVVSSQISNSATGVPNTAEFYSTETTVSIFAGLTSSPRTVAANEHAIFTSIYNGASSLLFKNGTTGVAADAGAQGADGIRLAGFQGSTSFSATAFQEYVVFQSVLSSADRLLLERSQAAYYGITYASLVSGFVTTWYDQSGNGRNAVQTTAANQPRIVGAGVVSLFNNQPSVQFISTSSTRLASSFVLNQPEQLLCVLNPRVFVAENHVWVDGFNIDTINFRTRSSSNADVYAGSFLTQTYPWQANIPMQSSILINGSSSQAWKNGTSIASGNAGTLNAGGLSLGNWSTGTRASNVQWAELIVFPSVLTTADRQTLERNQGAAFGIAVA